MSIQDVQRQFEDETGGKVKLLSTTMDYRQGGGMQEFSFRVSYRGATNTIVEPCAADANISEAVSKAAADALAWAATIDANPPDTESFHG